MIVDIVSTYEVPGNYVFAHRVIEPGLDGGVSSAILAYQSQYKNADVPGVIYKRRDELGRCTFYIPVDHCTIREYLEGLSNG